MSRNKDWLTRLTSPLPKEFVPDEHKLPIRRTKFSDATSNVLILTTALAVAAVVTTGFLVALAVVTEDARLAYYAGASALVAMTGGVGLGISYPRGSVDVVNAEVVKEIRSLKSTLQNERQMRGYHLPEIMQPQAGRTLVESDRDRA